MRVLCSDAHRREQWPIGQMKDCSFDVRTQAVTQIDEGSKYKKSIGDQNDGGPDVRVRD